uniref:FecR family protein n=1 Tax=unclassified Variovorax TaxID=663243 RepID=UPI000D402F61
MTRLPPPDPDHPPAPPSARAPQACADEQRDERELAGYMPTGDAIDRQAAAWLLRRRHGLDAHAEARFQAWLAQDPAHRGAFARHEGAWAELDALPADGVRRLRDGLSRHGAPAAEPARQGRGRAGAWRGAHTLRGLMPHATAAALAVLVATGGWLGYDHWQHRALFSQSFATARGQLLDVTLPDGSRLQLDTATRAEVTLYRQRREVRLPQGQSAFQVQSDPDRPFDVLAGPLRITVLGTRFSVRYTADAAVPGGAPGSVRVAVEEGRVRVAPASAPVDTGHGDDGADAPLVAGAGVLLTAGQAVSADSSGHLSAVAPTTAAAFAPWRNGRIAFDDMPLSEVLAEFERYGDTRLRIADPAVARLRISGSADARQPGNFARALPHALPVALRDTADGQREIVAAP